MTDTGSSIVFSLIISPERDLHQLPASENAIIGGSMLHRKALL